MPPWRQHSKIDEVQSIPPWRRDRQTVEDITPTAKAKGKRRKEPQQDPTVKAKGKRLFTKTRQEPPPVKVKGETRKEPPPAKVKGETRKEPPPVKAKNKTRKEPPPVKVKGETRKEPPQRITTWPKRLRFTPPTISAIPAASSDANPVLTEAEAVIAEKPMKEIQLRKGKAKVKGGKIETNTDEITDREKWPPSLVM